MVIKSKQLKDLQETVRKHTRSDAEKEAIRKTEAAAEAAAKSMTETEKARRHAEMLEILKKQKEELSPKKATSSGTLSSGRQTAGNRTTVGTKSLRTR